MEKGVVQVEVAPEVGVTMVASGIRGSVVIWQKVLSPMIRYWRCGSLDERRK